MGDTSVSDPHYDLVSVLYHALQGSDTINKYIDDVGDDEELANFFRQVKQGYDRAAQQAKQLLVARVEHEH